MLTFPTETTNSGGAVAFDTGTSMAVPRIACGWASRIALRVLSDMHSM